MKKAYIAYLNNCSERYALYVGIGALSGGWLMETGGDPCTLNDLEDAYNNGSDTAEGLIDSVNKLIADPATPWEELGEEDKAYVQEWLEIWGLAALPKDKED